MENKTIYEQSIKNNSNHLLANTSAISGDYLVLPIYINIPLPSIILDYLHLVFINYLPIKYIYQIGKLDLLSTILLI